MLATCLQAIRIICDGSRSHLLRLNHPTLLVTIYGAEAQGDVAYIAMELVRGHTLRKLSASGCDSCKEGSRPGRRRCVAAAHAGGVVHRDLKPENIMVTAEELRRAGFRFARHNVT